MIKKIRIYCFLFLISFVGFCLMIPDFWVSTKSIDEILTYKTKIERRAAQIDKMINQEIDKIDLENSAIVERIRWLELEKIKGDKFEIQQFPTLGGEP